MKKIGYIVVALVMLLLGFFQSYKFACDGGSKLALPIDEVNAEENIHKGEDVSESTEIIVGDRVETVEKSNVSNSTVGYFQVLTSNLPIYDNRSGELEQVGHLQKAKYIQLQVIMATGIRFSLIIIMGMCIKKTLRQQRPNIFRI
ncbi:hypothetical protein CV093_18665 [Oceanobacillus sp. 143]|nr:hypothetical protein CV093_18665 [Oceanobacillus sp. 143]